MAQWENKVAMRNAWASGLGEALQILAQMAAQRNITQEANTFAKNNPLFDESITKGSMAGVPQPTVAQYTPRIDNLISGLQSTNPLIQQGTKSATQLMQMRGDFDKPQTPFKFFSTYDKAYKGNEQTGEVSPIANINRPETISTDSRTVLDETGNPKIVDINGVMFTVSEKYDKRTNQAIPNSFEFKKVDDKTNPSNIYADLARDRLIANYQSRFNADPTIKAINEQGLSLGAVNQLIDQARAGNQVSAAALGVKMAKVMGEVGMLSTSDVTRYVEAKSLTRGSADILQKWMNGVPTNATLDDISAIAKVLRAEFINKSKTTINKYVKQMASGMKISEQQAREYLATDSILPETATETGISPSGAKKRSKPDANADPLGIR